MGISPGEFRAMEDRVNANRKKYGGAVALPEPVQEVSVAPVSCQIELHGLTDQFQCLEFTYQGIPVGKPRMTQQDKYVMRPAAKKYWDFKAALKAAAGPMLDNPDIIAVTAWVPMKGSWPKSKQQAMAGKPCRLRPDCDNLVKAVMDALFDEDCCIWAGLSVKYWCWAGQEKVNVKVFYAKSK